MTPYPEEDWLLLSGLQHFAFCPRQWALIHLEGQWAEDLRTVEGELLHQRAHDERLSEKRGDLLTVRGLRVFSAALGVTGACDVVEFHADSGGIPLAGREGFWRAVPVEYKRGSPKPHQADELQLCAQAMCLEEMLCCAIPEGFLYYGETRRRVPVACDDELRGTVKSLLEEMHRYAARGYTPKGKPTRGCGACSLKELCLPSLRRSGSAADYLDARLGEEDAP